MYAKLHTQKIAQDKLGLIPYYIDYCKYQNIESPNSNFLIQFVYTGNSNSFHVNALDGSCDSIV